MKQLIYTVLASLLLITACKKDEKVRTSGTDTIDNIRHKSSTFYVYGFSFSTADKISSEATPKPDIIVDTNNTPRPNIYLQGSINSSFYKYGTYPDESSAIAAFDALKSFNAASWEDWANPVRVNEIWIFRSNDEKYTKIRIVNTAQRNEQGIPVAEITFQWVHQPDGSLIFP